MSKTQRIQAVRGMNDVLPPETAVWRRLHHVCAEVFSQYGYEEIALPLVERAELFARSIGEVTDIVEKEMYRFEDRGGEALALRPEGTAGCVRAGIEHGLLHNQQQRLWYYGPMFRYERPQAGRYRQFYQYGVEAYGLPGPDVDVEIIALSARLWRRLGVTGLKLQLNSLGTPAARAAYRDALIGYLRAHEARLDADSKRRLATNPLRVLDSKEPGMREVLAGAPRITDSLDAGSAAHFAAVQQGLTDIGIGYALNPHLVRGLDYYTRTVFEWTTERLGAQDAVCAGGRYDGLVAQLGGGEVPACGFALGVERLAALLRLDGFAARAEAAAAPHAYFAWSGEAAQAAARRLAEQLRERVDGLRLILHAGGGGLSAQMKRADRSGAALALILGEREAAAAEVQVKSLRESSPQTAQQVTCPWSELPQTLADRLRLSLRG